MGVFLWARYYCREQGSGSPPRTHRVQMLLVLRDYNTLLGCMGKLIAVEGRLEQGGCVDNHVWKHGIYRRLRSGTNLKAVACKVCMRRVKRKKEHT